MMAKRRSGRSAHVERLDERGRATVRPDFRNVLKDGYVQVLTPEGVLFLVVPRRFRSKAPSLDDVDDVAMEGL